MISIKPAKLCFAITAVATCFTVQPSSAADFAYMSATGGGTTCTAAAPCGTFFNAIVSLTSNQGRILCLDPVADKENLTLQNSGVTLDIDCPAGSWAGFGTGVALTFEGNNTTVTIRNMAFNGVGGGATSAIHITGNGTLILENCAFANFSATALDFEPNGAFNLVIKNSRISNSASGILLKPTAGGSINATLDHVTIANNTGGGTKVDTTNGPVTMDITDSVVSNNVANGINAVGNAGGQTMVSIKNSVIAKNGLVGVQANGANAGVLVQTTLLDQNVAGATSVVNGGHISTYGNNSIVGSSGSGFTGPAPLQ